MAKSHTAARQPTETAPEPTTEPATTKPATEALAEQMVPQLATAPPAAANPNQNTAEPPAAKKKRPAGFELELSILAQIRRRLDLLPTPKAKRRCVEMLTEYYVESQEPKPPAGE